MHDPEHDHMNFQQRCGYMTPQDVTLVPPAHLQLQLEDVNVACERSLLDAFRVFIRGQNRS